MNNIQTDKHGTRYTFNSDGQMIAECQFCNTWFVPNRRFNQRYCSNSCKTMASNHRHGLPGPVSYQNKDKTTNSALKNQIKELEKKIDRNMKLNQKEVVIKLDSLNTEVRWAKYASVIHLIIGFLKALSDATIDEQVISHMKEQIKQNEELEGLVKDLEKVTHQDTKLAEMLAGLR